jgi:hypothetical protein
MDNCRRKYKTFSLAEERIQTAISGTELVKSLRPMIRYLKLSYHLFFWYITVLSYSGIDSLCNMHTKMCSQNAYITITYCININLDTC